MAIVKLFGTLRRHGDETTRHIPGKCVQDVLTGLCASRPGLCHDLLVDGVVRPHYKITLNGHDISITGGLSSPVNADDQIAIFSPIAGG